jgi:hypothetical protein
VEGSSAGSLLISRSGNGRLVALSSNTMSIFFVQQRCSTKTEELPADRKIEEAKEPLRDLDGESSVIKDTASREFSSCHMTSTERLEARLGSVSKQNKTKRMMVN